MSTCRPLNRARIKLHEAILALTEAAPSPTDIQRHADHMHRLERLEQIDFEIKKLLADPR